MQRQEFHSLNHLLAALPESDYHRLLPHLEPIALPAGLALQHAGDPDDYVYFLTSGVVSHVCVTEGGASAEAALAGVEGAMGLSILLGGHGMPGRAVVVSAGSASRLPGRIAMAEHDRGGPFARLMLRYVLALIAQTGQHAACNRHHSLEQRLCRWILSILDRLDSAELVVKHEVIADMLGVRRATITDAAAKLESQGLLRCGRGHLTLVDRSGLEGRACECYAAVKREYQRLLPGCCNAQAAAEAPDRVPDPS